MKTIELDYDRTCIFRNSDAAWFVYFEYHTRNDRNNVAHFMPKSQCELDEDNKTITVPLWLAEKKGLI